jgi:hypothetical protein
VGHVIRSYGKFSFYERLPFSLTLADIYTLYMYAIEGAAGGETSAGWEAYEIWRKGNVLCILCGDGQTVSIMNYTFEEKW